jgi:hypothetical protein
MRQQAREKVLSTEDFYLHLIEQYPSLKISDLANMNACQRAILNRGPSTVEYSGPDATQKFLELQARLRAQRE